jgi:mono/diheme cytochrome c family protein
LRTRVSRFIGLLTCMRRAVSEILLVLMLAALAGGAKATTAGIMTPLDRVASTPKGQLKSPYPDFNSVAAEGHRKYMAAGCNGCHGGGGGGGMAPPLTNPIWIYGDDDDTLFRLIALGTGKLSPGDAFGKLGYRRKGSENVVGPMPNFGEVIKTDDDLWKIIGWMRSVYCERRAEGC